MAKEKVAVARRAGGFTLIELLVVIAIIAILAAILFPVFISAKQRANATSCLMYCKQAATALQNYTGDWSETLPPYSNANGGLWWTILQPYIKNKGVYICPATRQPDTANGSWSTPYGTAIWGSETHRWQFVGHVGSYCINGWLNYDRNNDDLTPMKLSQITRPTRTMAFSDGNWVDTWPGNREDPKDPNGNMWRIYLGRHNGGINMVFVDGSARWIPKTALAIPNPRNRRVVYNPRTND